MIKIIGQSPRFLDIDAAFMLMGTAMGQSHPERGVAAHSR
jgi:hypothetical protein